MHAGPVSLGWHPETHEKVLLCQGRFGPYLQLGDNNTASAVRKVHRGTHQTATTHYMPKRASLKYGWSLRLCTLLLPPPLPAPVSLCALLSRQLRCNKQSKSHSCRLGHL